MVPSDPRVPEALDNRFAVVLRMVVYNDQFEVLEGLPQDALDGGSEMSGGVPHRMITESGGVLLGATSVDLREQSDGRSRLGRRGYSPSPSPDICYFETGNPVVGVYPGHI